jgi:hypothetical protein
MIRLLIILWIVLGLTAGFTLAGLGLIHIARSMAGGP